MFLRRRPYLRVGVVDRREVQRHGRPVVGVDRDLAPAVPDDQSAAHRPMPGRADDVGPASDDRRRVDDPGAT